MGEKTPFFDIHKFHKAHMIEFAGWDMPLYYSGIIEEHKTVRTGVGLFDISHMGRIEIRGKDSLMNLQKILVGNIEKLSIKQVKYTALCNEEGGIIDDLTIYRLTEDKFLLCVNASNTERVYKWIFQNIEGEVEVIDQSAQIAQLAIQGPNSLHVLQKLTSTDLSNLRYYWFDWIALDGIQAIVSRTGYTGEDGFEIYFRADIAIQMWDRLISEGLPFGIKPIGLGARDTLRLEMGFPLYGNELNSTNTLLESGLERLADFEKNHFIGKDALLQQKIKGITQRVAGFEMIEEGIPRSHFEIYKNEEKVGIITSGTWSPTLGKGIGLGYLKSQEVFEGNCISVKIRRKKLPAKVVRIPFYNRFRDKVLKSENNEKYVAPICVGDALKN